MFLSEAVFQGPNGQYLLEILFIVIGAFILGFLFRYFLNDGIKRKMKRLKAERDEALAIQDVKVLKEKYEGIIKEKDERIAKLNKELSNFKAVEIETASKAIKAAKNKTDDLVVIEGVGPKIAQILKESGLKTFKQLSSTDPKKIRKVLMKASPAYAVHNPETWPEQAKMAEEGKLEELKEFQKKLKAGRRRS